MFKIIKSNIIIIIAVPIVIGLFIFIKNSTSSDVFTNADDFNENDRLGNDVQVMNDLLEEEHESIIVDIKGAVKQPGVYEFQSGARVNDLILEAGGFLKSADDVQVNLAQKLQDEMIVIVPNKGDEQEQGVVSSQLDDQEQMVKINYATVDQLETLPGVGPSKAKAIIDYRDEHGFFKNQEDLLNISGIGEKTLENLSDYIQVP